MDWIERLIGISPDGGDGTAEAAILFVCVIVFGAVMALRVPSLRQRIGEIFGAWRVR
jgi:hypothetical protein